MGAQRCREGKGGETGLIPEAFDEIRDADVGKMIVKGLSKVKGWVNETGYIKHLTHNELNVTPRWGGLD